MQKRNTTSSAKPGLNLKLARIASGMKQTELAEASGFAQTDISYWENHGIGKVTCSRARRLARALGKSIEELMDDD